MGKTCASLSPQVCFLKVADGHEPRAHVSPIGLREGVWVHGPTSPAILVLLEMTPLSSSFIDWSISLSTRPPLLSLLNPFSLFEYSSPSMGAERGRAALAAASSSFGMARRGWATPIASSSSSSESADP